MSQRFASFVFTAFLLAAAAGSGMAWAGGPHGNDWHNGPQADHYPVRGDQVYRDHAGYDYPVRNDHQDYQRDRYQGADPGVGELQSSVRRVQRETGGQILRAQPILRDGREVYRVKVLTPQGRIRVYEDDSSSQQHPVHREPPHQRHPR